MVVLDTGRLAEPGTALWSDEAFKVLELPPMLEGSTVGNLSYKLPHKINIMVEVEQVSSVYMAIHSANCSDNNLSDLLVEDGWTKEIGNILFEGSTGSEFLACIWSNELTSLKTVNFSRLSGSLTIAIFIKPGEYTLTIEMLCDKNYI